MTTKTFDPAIPLEEVLDFVGAADVGGALANVGSMDEVVHLLKVEGAWEEADGSSAELDARNHLVIRIRE